MYIYVLELHMYTVVRLNSWKAKMMTKNNKYIVVYTDNYILVCCCATLWGNIRVRILYLFYATTEGNTGGMQCTAVLYLFYATTEGSTGGTQCNAVRRNATQCNAGLSPVTLLSETHVGSDCLFMHQ